MMPTDGEIMAGEMPPPDSEFAEGDASTTEGEAPPTDGEYVEGETLAAEGELAEGELVPAEGEATADGGDGGLGDLLDAAISTEDEEPALDESAEPTSADLSLKQAVCETEAEQTTADSSDAKLVEEGRNGFEAGKLAGLERAFDAVGSQLDSELPGDQV